MAMDSNFERLEQEVNRLVEVLNRLRQENTELKSRIGELEQQQQQSQGEINRLQQVEGEFIEVSQSRDEVKGRIESLLQRLDGLEM
jgi:FtsZ-binding cell division protein ZapB